MPNPFQFETRRRSVQRFLKLSSLNIESLWFPRVQEILKTQFPPTQTLKLAIDTLIGGMGSDRFVLSTNSGIDTVLNFSVRTDKFVLADG